MHKATRDFLTKDKDLLFDASRETENCFCVGFISATLCFRRWVSTFFWFFWQVESCAGSRESALQTRGPDLTEVAPNALDKGREMFVFLLIPARMRFSLQSRLNQT